MDWTTYLWRHNPSECSTRSWSAKDQNIKRSQGICWLAYRETRWQSRFQLNYPCSRCDSAPAYVGSARRDPKTSLSADSNAPKDHPDVDFSRVLYYLIIVLWVLRSSKHRNPSKSQTRSESCVWKNHGVPVVKEKRNMWLSLLFPCFISIFGANSSVSNK